MFKKVPYGLAALTVLKVDRALGVQLAQHQQKWNADQTNVQLGAEHRHHHKHHHHQLAQSIPACNSVECKTETAAPNKLQKDQDPWDKDYFVPNFGADHDILDSQSNHVNAGAYCKDGLCGQPWVVAAQKGTGSIPACNSVECKTETAAAAKLQKDTDPWDKDYFVPNFGVDHDIVATHSNAAAAKAYCAGDGARCGQQWQVAAQKASIPACNSVECKTETAAAAKLQKDTDPWDKDYPVPNFGVDHDILDSHSNAANAATFCKGGKCGQPWVVAAQGQSVPACNSIECKTETAADSKLQKDTDKWDKDYFVPNFGMDHDIVATHKHLKDAQAYCAGGDARCGQPWYVAAQRNSESVPACTSLGCATGTSAKGEEDTGGAAGGKQLNDAVGLKSLAQQQSIPACNSVECKTETAAPNKLQKDQDPWDKDYPVPNFGVDHDILDSHASHTLAGNYCKTGNCGQQWNVAAQIDSDSRPSCTSFECKTGTAAPKVATPLWAVHYEPEIGVSQVQLGEASIPACNSIECLTKTVADDGGPPKHPQDYKVADFGLDHDIVASIDNLHRTQNECLTTGLAFGKCSQPWELKNLQLNDVYESTEDGDIYASFRDSNKIKAKVEEKEFVKQQALSQWIPNGDEIQEYREMQ